LVSTKVLSVGAQRDSWRWAVATCGRFVYIVIECILIDRVNSTIDTETLEKSQMANSSRDRFARRLELIDPYPGRRSFILTNRHFLGATTVFVILFCLWPNFLSGFLAFLVIGSWLAHDANGFLQIVWRIVFLAGIWWTGVWFACPNATRGALSAEGAITIGLMVV
jgi:hypothetical protein